MKVQITALIMICVILSSCSKNNTSEHSDAFNVCFNVEAALTESGDVITKSYMSNLEFRWSVGDRVGIYPDSGGQVYFEVPVTEENSSTAIFDGGGWAFRTDSRYVSYFPVVPEFYLDRENVPITYLGQRQTGKLTAMNSTPESLSPFDYLCTSYVQAENGSLTFNYLHVGYFWMFRLSSLPAGTYKQLTVTAPTDIFVSTGHLNLNAENGNYTVIPDTKSNTTTIILDNVVVNSTNDDPFLVYMMGAPIDLSGQSVTVSVVNSEKKQFDCTKAISKAYERKTFYGLACSSWTEVPQSVSIGIDDWGDGSTIGGSAN